MIKGLLEKSVFLLLMLWALPPASFLHAAAAKTSLFFIQNIKSHISLDYEFDRQNYDFSDSRKGEREYSQHTFEETYTASLNYAIYNHKYWTGKFKVRLGYEQDKSEESSAQDSWLHRSVQEYRTSGILLKNSRAPLSLKAYSEVERISRTFSRDYKIDTDSYNVTLDIKSKNLPSTIRLSSKEDTTSGLDLDRTTTSKSISLSTNNAYRNLSATSYSMVVTSDEVVFSDPDVEGTGTDSMNYYLWNGLKLPYFDRAFELKSSYRFLDEAGDREGRESVWREDLYWNPGRAMKGNFFFRKESQQWFDLEQDLRELSGSLSHQLFHSVVTTVHAKSRDIDFHNGTEEDEYIAGKVSYTKNLANTKKFRFSLEEKRGTVERDLSTNRITVLEEGVEVSLVEPNLLANSDVDVSTVFVIRGDTRQTVDPSEYQVLPFGDFIELSFNPGSSIGAGDVVLVSYEYLVDPSVKYANDSTALSASLSMFDNSLNFYGRMLFSSQERLAGSDNVASLESSNLYNAGVKGRTGRFVYGTDGKYIDRTSSQSFSSSTYLTYSKTGKETRISTSSRYIFQHYKKGYSNISHRLSNSVRFSRKFRKNITFRCGAEHLLSISGGEDTQEAEFAVGADAQIGKTYFSIVAEDDWRFVEAVTERATRVQFSMRREF